MSRSTLCRSGGCRSGHGCSDADVMVGLMMPSLKGRRWVMHGFLQEGGATATSFVHSVDLVVRGRACWFLWQGFRTSLMRGCLGQAGSTCKAVPYVMLRIARLM